MKKSLLIGLVIILIVINLSSLGTILYFHFFHKPPHIIPPGKAPQGFNQQNLPGPPQLPGAFLKEDLKLSDEQLEQFDNSIKQLHDKMKPLFESIRTAREALMDEILSEEISQQKVDSLLTEIAALQTQTQREVINQLSEEISILEPAQKVKFKELLKEGHHHMDLLLDIPQQRQGPLSPKEARNPPRDRRHPKGKNPNVIK
ncbi:periplasmic heavy metal sensor [bacterium]|nr:periplasmic heavy metal sensor [bacterium]